MLDNALLSTTALRVAHREALEAGVASEHICTDSNVQFIAWYAAPMLAAIKVLRNRVSVVAGSLLLGAAAPAAASTYTIVDMPSASRTSVEAINTGGSVTGDGNPSGVPRGFLRTADGTFTIIDATPTATSTWPIGINRRGEIAGFYTDRRARVHGFLRKPSGKIIRFDVEGGKEPEPTAINDDGAITGRYSINSEYHGFLRAQL